jgi:hypothetical protein
MSSVYLDAWRISIADFPWSGSPADKLRFLLGYAILAPSGHNTQPWRFRVVGDTVELCADRSRALPVNDPDNREMVIACGAALFNLRIAIRRFGYTGEVTLLPDPGQGDLLARVRLGAPWEATLEESALFDALPRRRTFRGRFDARDVPEGLVERLRSAATVEGATLFRVSGIAWRHALAELVAEGDRRQMADKRFRRELAAWIHANRSYSHDGMPAYALGIPGLLSSAATFFIRTFDMGDARAARDRDIAEGSPLLVILATGDDTPDDWLHAGQALEHVLLQAASEGVYAGYLNQPCQVAELRSRMPELFELQGVPQLVLRMGYGTPIEHTPRRGVVEVVG